MGRKQRLKEQKTEDKNIHISRAISEKDKGTLYHIIYLGLIILLLYPPYFRGMFFDKEFLPTHMYSGILFLLYIIYKAKVLKEHRFFTSPMDYAAIALVGAYFLSLFVAVNIRLAVGELLKYINYFMVYYMVSDIARTEKDIRIILSAMVLSAFGVAFIGIGAAAGSFDYPGAFVGGRINSTIQYPNTLAAYLTAAFMISTSLWVTAQKRWQRAILALVNYTFFLCFLFTLSRAAWLMFPVFFLILIVGMPGQYRMKTLGYSVQTFISAIIASPGFGSAIAASQGTKTWTWYIVGAVVALVMFYAVDKASERFAFHIKPKVVLSVFLVLAVLVGVGGYVALTTEAPLILSHGENEEESWKISWYTIEDVKPDTEYTLKVNVTIKPGKNEEEWGGAVLVNSFGDKNDDVEIKSEYFNEGLTNENREVTFRTRPDTKSIRIGLSNRFPGTIAFFNGLELYETENILSTNRITLAHKYIPEAISKRIANISTEESSFTARTDFYKDALKIIKDHPILGTGGGGWKTIYLAYQSYQYFTTEVHNFFLQLWVETGTVGMLALVALWLTSLITGYKVMRSDSDAIIKVLTWGVLSGAIALGGHSAMDFNLSLGGIALYLWQLFGIAKSTNTVSGLNYNKELKLVVPSWAFSGVACVLIVVSFFLYQGHTYGQQAVESIQGQDIMKTKEYFQKAAKYDPLTSSFKADLAQLEYFIAQQSENDTLLDHSEDIRLEAVNLDPYNPKLKTQLAAYYLEQGKIEDGISELEKATEINPFNIENWENLADAYQKAAVIYITQEQKDKALELTEKSQDIFSKLSEYNSKTPEHAREKLEVTNDLMLYVYKSRLLAENIDYNGYHRKLENLIFACDFAVDVNNDGIPDLWRVYNSQKGLLELDMQKEVVAITNKGEGPSYLLTKNDIILKPCKLHNLSLFIASCNPNNKPNLNIISRNDNNMQYQLKNMNIASEITNVSSAFMTSVDIEDESQWLSLDIPENTTDPIFVKSIEIWLE